MFKKYFQKLKIDNLYIGYVAPVRRNNQEYFCDTKKARLIAFSKDNLLPYNSQATDVRTGMKYYYFCRYIGLNELVGSEAICSYVPLANYLSNAEKMKGSISKEKIGKLLEDLTHPKKEQEVNDPILKLILSTSSKVKKMSLEEKDKKYLYDLLSDLGKYYISELIKIQQETDEIKLEQIDPTSSLRLDVINRLNMIESKINESAISGKLNLDYQQFNRVLKKEFM